MKESYCGLCDECQLGDRDFLEALVTVKGYLDTFRENWWAHCFPGEEGFSFPEFRRGLEWFLSHTECPGCKGGKGLDHCPIRLCAMRKNQGHCYECPDLMDCEKFSCLVKEFPDQKAKLRRQQLKYVTREFHAQNL
ncbi:MAG: DUF3795 domain-containing protein [Thermodesulfobacteriota bacterium]